MNTDPRGPIRTITTVEESPTGGPTFVTLSCGHRCERANHFHYHTGDRNRCFTCQKEGTTK